MQITQIYAVAAGGFLMSFILYNLCISMLGWIQDRTLFLVFKHLIYPVLIRRRRLLGPCTRWQALAVLLYLTVTTTFNLVGIRDVSQLGTRAGTIAVVHLIPLLFGDRLSFGADLLGISIHNYSRLHGSIGAMALIQSLIHILIFVTRNRFRIHDQTQFYGLLIAVAMSVIGITLVVRHYLYEVFQKSHYVLALTILYFTWRHLEHRSITSRLYVYVATSLFAIITAIRFGRLLFRNVVRGQSYRSTELQQVNGAIRLRIKVARPWDIRAGQYIYVWMAGVSFWSTFQDHPFAVCWWDEGVNGAEANIYLLIKPRSGFTQKLLRHSGSQALSCWIDGPYGRAVNAADYGTVLMFATGIGIASQVPCIKQLLQEFGDARTRTQKVSLVWQMDEEKDQDWVREWMNDLLDKDKNAYILQISLYVLRNFESSDKSYGDKEQYGAHDRIRKLYGAPNLEEIVRTEVNRKKGSIIITTSVESAAQDKIQRAVRELSEKDVRLVHLAFRPREEASFWARRLPDVKYEGMA